MSGPIYQSRAVSAGNTVKATLNLKLQLLPSHFGLSLTADQQANKGVIIQAGVFDLDLHEEIGFPCRECRKEYVHHAVDSLEYLLVLPCPFLTVHGQLQQP